MRTERAVNFEEAHYLVHYVLEAAGLVAIGGRYAIAVHWVGDPKRSSACIFGRLNKLWKLIANLACTHARNQGQTTWFTSRV